MIVNRRMMNGRKHSVCLCLAGLLMVTSCSPPSLLITMVPSQRNLVETELSRDSFFARNKIALIDVNGVLRNTQSSQLFGEGEQPVSLFLEQLDMAKKDQAVKAVILRINSPGGTVVASELMYDELTHFKKETGKPVVGVMMDLAASGGYYLACACDEIVAQPSTITGSIGVIMQLFDVSDTLKLIGIKSNAIKSGINKDIGSPFHAMSQGQREIFQGIIDDMYDRFVDVVVEGRPKLDDPTVRRLADGRVYTAGQALEVGLIDRIAPLREVIASLKEKLGGGNFRLVTYHRSSKYKPNYYARVAPFATRPSTLQLNLSNLPTYLTPQFMYLWTPNNP